MKNKYTMIEGGGYEDDETYFQINFHIPTLFRGKYETLHKQTFRRFLFSFPTKIDLTSTKKYVKVKLILFGFGISFEVEDRS